MKNWNIVTSSIFCPDKLANKKQCAHKNRYGNGECAEANCPIKQPPKQVVEAEQASFCGNWGKCEFPGYRKCNKDCSNYTPAI